MTQGTDFIHSMRVLNTDAPSYLYKTSKKCLDTSEKEKKKKYLNSCLKKSRYFLPFVASVDGLLGVEAEATRKRISSRLVTKWKEPYSSTCGYVKNRVVINIFRAIHRCIRVGKVPASKISTKLPQWEESAGMHIYR